MNNWRIPRFLASLIAPILVVGVIPLWLIHNRLAAYDTRWPAGSAVAWIGRLLGGSMAFVGLGLFAWCVTLFARLGRGTIMPWDPTQRLVVSGPYRHVRNPMISGVLFMVAGQALYWGSWLTGSLALFFFLVNHFYFILSEEPGLEKRFGENYRRYKANVPRWRPHIRPWTDG
jgi:protein-S-isoprenylcysteine O-methyltransferase Ste14